MCSNEHTLLKHCKNLILYALSATRYFDEWTLFAQNNFMFLLLLKL